MKSLDTSSKAPAKKPGEIDLPQAPQATVLLTSASKGDLMEQFFGILDGAANGTRIDHATFKEATQIMIEIRRRAYQKRDLELLRDCHAMLAELREIANAVSVNAQQSPGPQIVVPGGYVKA